MDRELQARIQEKVTQAANGCWIWLGASRGVGYGAIKVNGKVIDAHRASYMAFKGDIPDGMLVTHNCDVRGCVNPDHLLLGTHKTNTQEAIERGRRKCWQRTRETPLTEDERQAIFRDIDGGVSERVVCRKHSIAPTSLKRLLSKART